MSVSLLAAMLASDRGGMNVFNDRVRTEGSGGVHVELSHDQEAQRVLQPGEGIYVRPRI
jgi:hypothetical protein